MHRFRSFSSSSSSSSSTLYVNSPSQTWDEGENRSTSLDSIETTRNRSDLPCSTRGLSHAPLATSASRHAAHSVADPRASSKNFGKHLTSHDRVDWTSVILSEFEDDDEDENDSILPDLCQTPDRTRMVRPQPLFPRVRWFQGANQEV